MNNDIFSAIEIMPNITKKNGDTGDMDFEGQCQIVLYNGQLPLYRKGEGLGMSKHAKWKVTS